MTNETTKSPDYLYYLYFEEDGQENIFYAGVSIEPHVRFKQHLNDTSDTKKARFIRHLISLGIHIKYSKVRQCTQPDDEYFYKNELEQQGYTLLNSIEGNINRKVHKEPKPRTTSIAPSQLSGKWEKSFQERTWMCRRIGSVFIQKKTLPCGQGFKLWIDGQEKMFTYPHAKRTEDNYQIFCDDANKLLK